MEYVFLVFGLPLLALLTTVSAILLAIKRSRAVGRAFSLGTLLLGVFYLFVYFGGNIIRETCAKSVIEQAAPLISAIDRYKQEKGKYPDSLTQLTPLYVKEIPRPRVLEQRKSNSPSFIYELINGNSYSLRFWLDGPPFGHHFIYTPSKEYPEWWTIGAFQLKKRIGDWGWYLKV